MLEQAMIFYGIMFNDILVDDQIHVVFEDPLLNIRSFIKGLGKSALDQIAVQSIFDQGNTAGSMKIDRYLFIVQIFPEGEREYLIGDGSDLRTSRDLPRHQIVNQP